MPLVNIDSIMSISQVPKLEQDKLTAAPMQLLLAPMEGLLDFVLRDALTRVGGIALHGGIDRCVSEFIRVTNTLLPARAFVRVMPELLNNSRTPSGVPVRGQLLGSDPVCVAENAARLASLGPEGVDLNFGCPAKVVNRHGGGAALLDEPELVAKIVAAVRRAVPKHQIVSAKMRLGFNDDSRAEECAIAIAEAGASELVVHARTKADGYRPPAYWARIADIRAVIKIPVIANGEIWNVEDARRCQALSGGGALMLGRGMVTDPGLALSIRNDAATPLIWAELLPLIQNFWILVCNTQEPRQRAGRLKQWLNFLRRTHPEAETAYTTIRTENDQAKITAWLNEQSRTHKAEGML